MARRSSLVLLFAFVSGCVIGDDRDRPIQVTIGREVDASRGAVVCVEENAARIGAQVLGRGGNAVDAAVAVAFALAVTWPEAGNIGGGGFMLTSFQGRERFFDYREVAPRAATSTMFLRPDGSVDVDAIDHSYRGVGVPGTVAGLELAHRELGSLPWSELVAPAIALARNGFTVSPALEKSIASVREVLAKNAESARIFLGRDGTGMRAGEWLVQPDLARSLERIARDGAAGFYAGDTAKLLVGDSERNGGILTLADLSDYAARERAPLRARYRGHEVIGAPPPSSGGQVVLSSLLRLEHFDLGGLELGDPRELHLLLESQRRAFLDRARFLADPDYHEVDLARLLSAEHAKETADSIDPASATRSDELAAGLDGTLSDENEHTTHFSIVDRAGNAVANTYTLEQSWGSKIVAKGTGILLNDEMGDFNPKPGSSTRKGRIGTAPNGIAPGKRMLSSMCPLIVKDEQGALLFVGGTPGGRTIPSTMLRVVTALIDHRASPRVALDAGRVHHGLFPDVARVEAQVSEESRHVLATFGHELDVVERQGDCHAIAREGATLRAFADSRIAGTAAAPIE